jgi:uncharacterized protein
MDWLHLYLPITKIDIFWPGLLLIGFSVGVIGGFFGMGGAWMVTPGLNILGFPMAFAIGTDMAHMAGNSIVSPFDTPNSETSITNWALSWFSAR